MYMDVCVDVDVWVCACTCACKCVYVHVRERVRASVCMCVCARAHTLQFAVIPGYHSCGICPSIKVRRFRCLTPNGSVSTCNTRFALRLAVSNTPRV